MVECFNLVHGRSSAYYDNGIQRQSSTYYLAGLFALRGDVHRRPRQAPTGRGTRLGKMGQSKVGLREVPVSHQIHGAVERADIEDSFVLSFSPCAFAYKTADARGAGENAGGKGFAFAM